MTRRAVLQLAVLAAVGLRATPGRAHAALVRAAPAPRGTVSLPPERVVLAFNERLEPAFVRVSVWSADGQQVDLKDGAVASDNDKVVAVSLPPLGPGRYTVRYRVLSVDGHVVEASFVFTITPRAGSR